MDETSYPDALPAQYRLHWYALERVLGQGGFGITYLARDTNLDRAVAIKEYLPVDVATRRADATVRPRTGEQTERYRWGLERFIREARTLARFEHPNIVRVHSVFEFNNTAYMVMRFEEGENLAALLERRRTLPEAELMRVLLPIVDGLQLVHDAGFIHRDIKPDNIHIRADGSPVLLDFGSARLALGHARTVTILVAPGYAPFEQYYGAGENQGPWTDIYGLGATCYRSISGIVPMDAISRSKGILGSTREMLVPAKAIGSGRYSERLLKAIDHALEFSEKDRPQSLAEWRRELIGAAPAVAPAPASAAPSPLAPPAPAAARLEDTPTVPLAPKPDRWSVLRGPVIGAVAGAIVAVAAITLWLRPGDNATKLREELKQSEIERMRLAEDSRAKEAKLQDEQERARRQREDEERRKSEATQLEQQRQLAAEARQREEQKAREAEALRIAEAARKKRQAPANRKAPAPQRTEVAAAALQPAPAQAAPPQPAAAENPAPKPQSQDATPAAAPKPLAREPLAAAVAKPAENRPPDDRSLALQGDPAAQYRMGELYENGRGVAQNNNQAYIWYSAAARGGYGAAKVKKEQMAARLQPAEIHQADRVVERLPRPAR